MLDAPRILEIPAQPCAVIPFTIPRAEMQAVMGPGLRELWAALAAQGLTPTGPWLTHHLRMVPDIWDFEIGLPVPTPVTAAGRVKPSMRPACTVARTVYQGSFAGLGAAWGELMAWITAQGHPPAEDLWECYLAGPEASPDPATWRTELTRPLLRQG